MSLPMDGLFFQEGTIMNRLRTLRFAIAAGLLATCSAFGQETKQPAKLPDVEQKAPADSKPTPEVAEALQEVNKHPSDTERISFNAELLLWWMNGNKVPPLATSGTTGILGAPGTSIVVGNDPLGDDLRLGARFVVGYWLNREHNLGLEANFLFVGDNGETSNLVSGGTPLLAQPFFNTAQGGISSAAILASPNTTPGAFSSTYTSNLWGAEANLRHNMESNARWSIDAIGGFRYLGLKENLGVAGTSFNPNPGPVTVGSVDNFKTNSDFYGAQIGASFEYHQNRWSILATPKLGIGGTHQGVNITGLTTVTANGASSTFNQGFLAQPSNIGQYGREVFTFLPELSVNVGWQALDYLKLYAGYNILYWSSVMRPGQAIDLNIGGTQPTFQYNGSELWLQGVNLGFEINF